MNAPSSHYMYHTNLGYVLLSAPATADLLSSLAIKQKRRLLTGTPPRATLCPVLLCPPPFPPKNFNAYGVYDTLDDLLMMVLQRRATRGRSIESSPVWDSYCIETTC